MLFIVESPAAHCRRHTDCYIRYMAVCAVEAGIFECIALRRVLR